MTMAIVRSNTISAETISPSFKEADKYVEVRMLGILPSVVMISHRTRFIFPRLATYVKISFGLPGTRKIKNIQNLLLFFESICSTSRTFSLLKNKLMILCLKNFTR